MLYADFNANFIENRVFCNIIYFPIFPMAAKLYSGPIRPALTYVMTAIDLCKVSRRYL